MRCLFINLLKLKEFIMKNSLLNLSDPFFSTRFLGFDSLFDSLRTFSEIGEDSRSYPPYNIKREGNDFTIEVAVAGLSEEDLTVETKENNLSIAHEGSKNSSEKSYIKVLLQEPLDCNSHLHLRLL
jgi:molecular chaperone IbpA